MSLLLFATVFLVVGGYFSYRAVRILREYTRTQGVIKDLVRGAGITGGRHLASIEFTTERGEKYSFLDERVYGNPRPAYLIGRQVTVCYDANDPSKAHMFNGSLFLIPFVLDIVGVFVLTVALLELKG